MSTKRCRIREFGLKIGTIADLIRYRLENEKSLERIAECNLKNNFGEFRLIAYRDNIDHLVHLAVVKGDISPHKPIMVRVHMPHYLNDVLGIQRTDNGWPLDDVLQKIAAEGEGVVVMLSQQDAQEEMVHRIKNYQHEDKGEKPQIQKPKSDLRTYGTGAQILLDLGVKKMRVMSAPKKIHSLSGFGLEVVEYVSNKK